MAQYASGKYSWGCCDVCGFRVPYRSLRPQYRDQRKTSMWVCPDCVDRNVPRRLGPINDPQALAHPRPDLSLDASRRIPHWKPVDWLEVACEIGPFEVRTDDAWQTIVSDP